PLDRSLLSGHTAGVDAAWHARIRRPHTGGQQRAGYSASAPGRRHVVDYRERAADRSGASQSVVGEPPDECALLARRIFCARGVRESDGSPLTRTGGSTWTDAPSSSAPQPPHFTRLA